MAPAPEDMAQATRQALVEDFISKYGLDPGEAAVMFRDAPAFHRLLEHMYLETMEELRECDIARDGQRIQGTAQVLYTLLSIPGEILEMKQ